jgi:hypothetical protein
MANILFSQPQHPGLRLQQYQVSSTVSAISRCLMFELYRICCTSSFRNHRKIRESSGSYSLLNVMTDSCVFMFTALTRSLSLTMPRRTRNCSLSRRNRMLCRNDCAHNDRYDLIRLKHRLGYGSLESGHQRSGCMISHGSSAAASR